MTEITYTYDGVEIAVGEPLARHELEAETARALLMTEWSERNNKPTTEVPFYNWKQMMRFSEIFVNMRIENDEALPDFVPRLPLDLSKPAALYDAMLAFWKRAPRRFVTKFEAAEEALSVDPNE
jgi:hypothetical protein